MLRIICICALMFLLGKPAWARLGETEEECISRYGTPLFESDVAADKKHLPEPSDQEEADAIKWYLPALEKHNKADKAYRLAFVKNGYNIEVCFMHGRAVATIYRKEDYSPLNDTEIKALLQAESGNRAWGDPTLQNGQKVWRRGTKYMARIFTLHGDVWLAFYELYPDEPYSRDSLEHERTMLKDF